ncbi:MAG: putative zinc-binding protein [Planctomycetota bacterium]
MSNETTVTYDSANSFAVEVQKTDGHCPIGETVGKRNIEQERIPVLSCEGGCIRGEIARLAANMVSKEQGFARGCHGELVTVPDSAIARWIRGVEKVILIDGCFLSCHGRILEGLLKKDQLVQFDALKVYRKYTDVFDIDEVRRHDRLPTACWLDLDMANSEQHLREELSQMPLYLNDLDMASEVAGLSSALIVPCNMCPAVTVAVREKKPFIRFFRNFLKSAPFERHIRTLQSRLREKGVKTKVFKSSLPHQWFLCMWTSGQHKKLQKHAKKHDAVIVLGCDSATETVRNSVKSTNCTVIKGMEVAGMINARLKFHLPCNVSFDDCKIIPISQEKKDGESNDRGSESQACNNSIWGSHSVHGRHLSQV